MKKKISTLKGKRFIVRDNSNNWFNVGEHVIITEDTNKGILAKSLERVMPSLKITLEQLTPFD